MDDMDIQQIAEQRKESYDIKQINKEFKANENASWIDLNTQKSK